jgi:hypothetical protein
MNEELHSELLLKCAIWLARADAYRAEAKRAVARRDQAGLSATASALEWAAFDLTALITSADEEIDSEKEEP